MALTHTPETIRALLAARAARAAQDAPWPAVTYAGATARLLSDALGVPLPRGADFWGPLPLRQWLAGAEAFELEPGNVAVWGDGGCGVIVALWPHGAARRLVLSFEKVAVFRVVEGAFSVSVSHLTADHGGRSALQRAELQAVFDAVKIWALQKGASSPGSGSSSPVRQ